MYISFNTPEAPPGLNLAQIHEFATRAANMSSWFVTVLYQLHYESGRAFYDEEFYRWLRTEWGITVNTSTDISMYPTLVGASIDDASYTALLIKFPIK